MKTVFSMSKSNAIKCIAACALAFTAGISSAAVTLFSGDTTGDPTWNRPLSGSPPSGLSGLNGTAARYEVIEFQVNNSATYDFRLTSTFDNYLFLYQSSFNPTAQLTNVIVGDDDSGNGLNAAFTSVLTSGAQYYLVATSFSNSDFGAFTGSITGAAIGDTATIGSVSPIPEPAEWAMMLAGLGVVSWAAKRRKG
jgi:hypothetical protein